MVFKSNKILRIRWLNYGKKSIVLPSFEVFSLVCNTFLTYV